MTMSMKGLTNSAGGLLDVIADSANRIIKNLKVSDWENGYATNSPLMTGAGYQKNVSLTGIVINPFVLEKNKLTLDGFMGRPAILVANRSVHPIFLVALREGTPIRLATLTFQPAGQIRYPTAVATVDAATAASTLVSRSTTYSIPIKVTSVDAAGETDTAVTANVRLDYKKINSTLNPTYAGRGSPIGAYQIRAIPYDMLTGRQAAAVVMDTTNAYGSYTQGNALIFASEATGNLPLGTNVQFAVVGEFNGTWRFCSDVESFSITASGGARCGGFNAYLTNGNFTLSADATALAYRVGGGSWHLGSISGVTVANDPGPGDTSVSSGSVSLGSSTLGDVGWQITLATLGYIPTVNLGVKIEINGKLVADTAAGVGGIIQTWNQTNNQLQISAQRPAVDYTTGKPDFTVTGDQIFVNNEPLTAKISWNANKNAVFYRVYATNVPGQVLANSYLIYEGSDPEMQWNGGVAAARNPPVSNTTASYPGTFTETFTWNYSSDTFTVEKGDQLILATSDSAIYYQSTGTAAPSQGGGFNLTVSIPAALVE